MTHSAILMPHWYVWPIVNESKVLWNGYGRTWRVSWLPHAKCVELFLFRLRERQKVNTLWKLIITDCRLCYVARQSTVYS